MDTTGGWMGLRVCSISTNFTLLRLFTLLKESLYLIWLSFDILLNLCRWDETGLVVFSFRLGFWGPVGVRGPITQFYFVVNYVFCFGSDQFRSLRNDFVRYLPSSPTHHFVYLLTSVSVCLFMFTVKFFYYHLKG